MPRASPSLFGLLPIYLSPATARARPIRLHQVWQAPSAGEEGEPSTQRRERDVTDLGIRVCARPIRHVHTRRAEGARLGEFQGHRPGDVCSARRTRPGLQPLLPLPRRPNGGRGNPSDRRGDGRSDCGRARAPNDEPARANRHGRPTRRWDGPDHIARCRRGSGAVSFPRSTPSIPRCWPSPVPSSTSGQAVSTPANSETAITRRCGS